MSGSLRISISSSAFQRLPSSEVRKRSAAALRSLLIRSIAACSCSRSEKSRTLQMSNHCDVAFRWPKPGDTLFSRAARGNTQRKEGRASPRVWPCEVVE
jgi:hypothetical protein